MTEIKPPCPCGYTEECPIWSGFGHVTGDCPRYEYVEISSYGEPGSRYIRGGCLHYETVPVENIITGEVLRKLCIDCDMVLDVNV